MWEYDKVVHLLFIDFKKVYDCIYIKSLLNILQKFGMPQKLVNITKTSIMHTEIKVGDFLPNGIQVTTGLRQDDTLYPVPFNIALEKVVREGCIERVCTTLGNIKIGILPYTEDLALLTENEEYIIKQTRKLLGIAKQIMLEVNEKKQNIL